MNDEQITRFITVHRLPGTFQAAMRYARRKEPAPPQPPAKPRMTWQQTSAWLKECGERVRLKAVPVEYDDPKAQASFDAVYRNRVHLLRG